MCHNPGTTDANSGNVVDLKIMAHKIHAGEGLKELFNQDYTIWGYRDSAHDYAEVKFPQDLRNCTKCHDNTKAAQADNWKNVPSRAACGACHAGIDFATGKGATIENAEADVAAGNPVGTTKTGHIGGAKADDSQCVLCHDATTIPEYHKTTIASTHNPVVKDGVASFEYKISGVTINASRQLVVKFQVLKNGTAVKFNDYASGAELLTGYTGGPQFLAIYATGQDGIAAPSDWNSGHGALTLKDAWAGANGNSLSAPDATNTYTATIAATSVSTRGTTTTPSYTLVLPADAKMVTGILVGSFTDATFGNLPGIPAMMAATGNTPDGKANVARRVIFAKEKCEACHDRLDTAPKFHGGPYSIAMCAACHTPIQGGRTGWSASFRVWVHGIHGAEKRTVPFTWHATFNFPTLGYPGVLKNCETCHLAGTYDFSASQYTTSLVDNMLYVQAATGVVSTTSADVPRNADGTVAYGLVVDGVTDYGTPWSIDKTTGTLVAETAGAAGQDSNLVSSPIAAVCTACHDDDAAISHIRTTGYGSFYSPRSTAIATKEQCLFCHGPGKLVPIADAHAK
jgi:OmcA/MtrC family decaheme c-type cytochrome